MFSKSPIHIVVEIFIAFLVFSMCNIVFLYNLVNIINLRINNNIQEYNTNVVIYGLFIFVSLIIIIICLIYFYKKIKKICNSRENVSLLETLLNEDLTVSENSSDSTIIA